MPAPQSNHAKGLLLTAIGGMALTADIPLIKLSGGDVWSVLMLRSGTTLLAALCIWAVWRTLTPRAPALVPGKAGAAVAVFYALSSIAFITAVYNTSTANVVFILAFNTMFAALLSWVFLKERPGAATLAAMAAMILGVLVIVGDGIAAGNLFGDMMALAASFLIASAITISRASGRDMGFTPLVATLLPFMVALGFVAQQGGLQISAPWWIVFNGAVVMPLSFYCLATGPRYISAPEVAMFYLLETVLAPVWVWMIFSEAPSTRSLAGGAVLVAALVAHSLWQIAQGNRRRRAARPPRHP
ncbi:MAG: EamA/RhaT family transporter [Hyphomicrobiales bacterium]|nr:MAG: EamA/RhaT family transporter [Hyphomicrobiales bacterium]